jgi:type VI secretion system protein ImpK
MGEPTQEAMYLASVDALTAAAQIGDGRGLAGAEVVRQQMIGLLRQLVANCREAGIEDAETAEARYAVVAFIDDRILKSGWHGRGEWQSNPLQLQLFREFTAGENFFARMRVLIARGAPVFALEVYYFCLALGFAGASKAGSQHSVRHYVDAARAALLRGRSGHRIAPNAIPPERHGAHPRLFPVALVAALACATLCLAGLVGLDFGLAGLIARARAGLPESPRVAAPADIR